MCIDNVPTESIELNKNSLLLMEGGHEVDTLSYTIYPETTTNKNVIWSSSNEDIATVDAKTGLVKAVTPGEAVIKATTADGSGVTATCEVTVHE